MHAVRRVSSAAFRALQPALSAQRASQTALKNLAAYHTSSKYKLFCLILRNFTLKLCLKWSGCQGHPHASRRKVKSKGQAPKSLYYCMNTNIKHTYWKKKGRRLSCAFILPLIRVKILAFLLYKLGKIWPRFEMAGSKFCDLHQSWKPQIHLLHQSILFLNRHILILIRDNSLED